MHNGVSLTRTYSHLVLRVSMEDRIIRKRVGRLVMRETQLLAGCPSCPRMSQDIFSVEYRAGSFDLSALRDAIGKHICLCNLCWTKDMLSFGVRVPCRALACVSVL